MHEVQHRWRRHIVLCLQEDNDVLALLKIMLTASGQTMLCPADTNTKEKSTAKAVLFSFVIHVRKRTGQKPRIFLKICK